MPPTIAPPTLLPSPALASYLRHVEVLMALDCDDLAAVDPRASEPIWVPVTTVSRVVPTMQ